MPGKGTTDVIFIMRNVEEKHHAKKKLYYAFCRFREEICPERGFEMGFEEDGCG